MKKYLFYLMAIAIAVVALTACREKEEDNIPVTGVTVSLTTVELTTGGTLTLTATVLPENATNKSITWTSNAAAVATVNNGLITAVAPGTVVITVTTQDGNKMAACTLTVTNATAPVTGVTVIPTTAEMAIGSTLTLTATVLPENASNKTVSWTSSNTAVVIVNNGLVTAVTPGTALITVTTQEGYKTAACTVTVRPQMTMITQQNQVQLILAGSGTMTIDWGNGLSTTSPLVPYGIDYNYTYSGSSTHTITITGNNVTRLICNSKLTALDVSNNAALTHLECRGNLTTLDVSNNAALTHLECRDNQLTTLGISNNTALTELSCSGNLLMALDVSNNTMLTRLNCYANQLTTLDVSNNTMLTRLDCFANQLTALDVSNNTALTHLQCYNNQLMTLDVSNNTALIFLNCSFNQLTALDVSNNTALRSLSCYNNQLTALDVSNNTALAGFWCRSNPLTALDVSNNTALTDLDCSSNQLTVLNVSKNTELIRLDCYRNQLMALNVSNNTALITLICYRNQLTATALNNLFGTLHSNNVGYKEIYIGGNSGTASCNTSIATSKGWTVDTVAY